MGSNQTPTEISVIFGTNAFGKFDYVPGLIAPFDTVEKITPILDALQSSGVKQLDTARLYGQGFSEPLLTESGYAERGMAVSTKLYPTAFRAAVMPGATKYTHRPEDLRAGLMASLDALKTKKLRTWYLYAPDRSTPFEDTLREVNNLYNEGHFERWGVCNFQSWEVARVQELCIRNGWVRPAVFQGIYNALVRSTEAELFPCLRQYGMAFEAAQPLASGMLTERYRRDMPAGEIPKGSRFDPDPKNMVGHHLRWKYWHDCYFEALEIIRAAAGKHDLTVNECALRWMVHHSKLDASLGDGIVMGASVPSQIMENCEDLRKGELPEDVVQAFEQAWPKAKGWILPYWH